MQSECFHFFLQKQMQFNEIDSCDGTKHVKLEYLPV